MVKFDTVIYM